MVDVGEAKPAPNLFAELDLDSDARLTKQEVLKFFFEKQNKNALPEGMWESEDKDGDGYISWAEFGGPKGDAPPSSQPNKDEV